MSDSTKADAPRPRWMGKLCPFLSQATMRPGVSASAGTPRLVTATMERVATQETHATACQGPSCMAFCPTQTLDQHGRPTLTGDGECALTLIPVAINVLGMNVGQLIRQNSDPEPTPTEN